jgi:hypothetical protein
VAAIKSYKTATSIGNVTPTFLAPNKSPNKSRVFQNFPVELIYPLSKPRSIPFPSARVPRIPPAPPAPGPSPTRAAPAPRSATTTGMLHRRGPAGRSASPSPPSGKSRWHPETRKIPPKSFLFFLPNFFPKITHVFCSLKIFSKCFPSFELNSYESTIYPSLIFP